MTALRRWMGLIVSLPLAGCTALLGFDGLHYDDEPASAAGQTGSSAGGTGLNGSGASSSATGGQGSGGGPAASWSVRFGGPSDERLAGLALATDQSIALGGSYRGAPTFGSTMLPDMSVVSDPGPFGSFVAMLGGDGTPNWSEGFGDAQYDHLVHGIDVGDDGVAVAGAFGGQLTIGASTIAAQGTDAFAFALAPDGTSKWVERFGGAAEEAGYGVAKNSSGVIAITGEYSSLSTFGGFTLNSFGATDVFLAVLDGSGSVQNAGGYGDGTPQSARSVAIDPQSGRMAMTGVFWGALHLSGSCVDLASAGGNDLFVAVFSSTAGCIWARRAGDASDQIDAGTKPENQSFPRVAFRPSGDVVVAGTFMGSADFGGGMMTASGQCPFVAEYGMDGSVVSSTTFPCTGTSAVEAISVSDTATALVGYFDASVDFGGGQLGSAGATDAFVVKLSDAGRHLWSGRYGDAAAQRATGVALAITEEVVIGGDFAGTIDLGAGTLVNPDASGNTTDVFVAKLPP